MTYLDEQIMKIINNKHEKYVENEEIMRVTTTSLHSPTGNVTINGYDVPNSVSEYFLKKKEAAEYNIINSLTNNEIFKKYVLNHQIFKENSNALELMVKKYSFDSNNACIKFAKGDKHAFDDLLKFMENDPRLEKIINYKPSEKGFLHKFVDDTPFLQTIIRKLSSFSRFWSDVITENPGHSSLIALIFIIVSVGFYKKIKK